MVVGGVLNDRPMLWVSERRKPFQPSWGWTWLRATWRTPLSSNLAWAAPRGNPSTITAGICDTTMRLSPVSTLNARIAPSSLPEPALVMRIQPGPKTDSSSRSMCMGPACPERGVWIDGAEDAPASERPVTESRVGRTGRCMCDRGGTRDAGSRGRCATGPTRSRAPDHSRTCREPRPPALGAVEGDARPSWWRAGVGLSPRCFRRSVAGPGDFEPVGGPSLALRPFVGEPLGCAHDTHPHLRP